MHDVDPTPVQRIGIRPCDYKPHHMGDGRRFHVREYNGGKYQVYGIGLEHICECERGEMADMIADALEAVACKCTCVILFGVLVTDSACPIHRLPASPF
jgi:hypothetical protein